MNAPAQVIFVVPVAGCPPGWDRSRSRPPIWQRKPADDRRQQWQRQAIPQPVVDRDLVEQLRKAGRRMLDETRSLRAAMLAA
jgi:hypothetical protein